MGQDETITTNGRASTGRSAGRPRVAVVIDAVGPWSKGGREVRYGAMLPRLAAAGLDIEVFTMKWWQEQPTGSVRYTAICPRLSLYKGERRSIFQATVFALSCLRLLSRKFDVILADQMPYLPLFPLRLVAWMKRVDLIVQWHELWGSDYWRGYLGKAGIVASAIESSALRLPDGIVAVADPIATRIVDGGISRERVVVIPNAVDKARLSTVPGEPRDEELLVVGRLMAHKHVDDALHATALLRADGRAVKLAVVGDGPERGRLEALAQELGIRDSVTFVGALGPQEEVWAWMKSVKVLISPSEREGFGLSVAESLALGTPVVCVDYPENDSTRLVTDGATGAIVQRRDIQALADAIATWLDDRVDASSISSKFWESHQDMDWDVSATLLAEYIFELASRNV